MTEWVSSIELTRAIARVIVVVHLGARIWRGADITAERNAPELKKFPAESSRVELPAKEIAAMPFGVRGKRGERLTRFLEKSQMNFSIQSNTGAL